MGESVRLGRVAGIPVGVNWSVLVIFWLISWSLAVAYLPSTAPDHPVGVYWLAAVPTALVFLACLLAHELAHSVVARSAGVGVERITLWLFGGVAQLRGEAATAGDSLRIAAVGPLASVGMGLGFGALGFVMAVVGGPELLVAVAVWLGAINIMLALFNLIPAAPLDGGRILAALLWRHHGDRVRAAVSAARAGMAFGYGLIAIGAAAFVGGLGLGGLWLLFIGWFLLGAARSESSYVLLHDALAGVAVRDVMTPNPVVAPAGLTIDAFLEQYVLRYRFSAFPIESPDGSLEGLVTLARLKTVPADRRGISLVREVACPLDEVPVAAPDEPIVELLGRLSGTADGRALVLTDGRLVGIVSPTDISTSIGLATLRPSRSPGPDTASPTRG